MSPSHKNHSGPQHAEDISRHVQQLARRRLYMLLFGAAVLLTLLAGVLVFFASTNGVRIAIQPSDARAEARLLLEGGLGHITDDHVIYAVSGRYSVRVEAPGFISQTLDVTPDLANRFVELELERAPLSVRAAAGVDEGDIRWTWEDAPPVTASQFEAEVKPGTYTLTAEHPFYRTMSKTVAVSHAQGPVELRFALERVTGTFVAQSLPTGATIQIQGKEHALPYAGPVEGGAYTVFVRKPGFKPITDQIEITQDQLHLQRTYRLIAEEVPLVATVTPADATVLLDGRVIRSGAPVSIAVNRAYSLEASAPGYVSQNLTVQADVGQQPRLQLDLAPAYGEVRVVSNPVGATVLHKGQVLGQTPLVHRFQAMDQALEVQMPGYRSAALKVQPRAGALQTVSANLRTELDARLAELGPSYRNRFRVELIRFKPDDAPFEIGAPRSAPHQRANEILRSVRLTKYFYVSKREVTVGQYQAFDAAIGAGQNKNLPVVGVTWDQAAAYCNFLSAEEKLEPVYVIQNGRVVSFNIYADGYRLPTEAEWEWLARSAGRDGQTPYSWGARTTITDKSGNLADETARSNVGAYIPNYTDGYAGLAPVGSFPEEVSGLQDMSGNVREWVHDRYNIEVPRTGQLFVNPFGPQLGSGHVVKGSSFRTANATEVRASSRTGADAPADDLGFRVARYVYGAEDRP